MYGEFLKVSRGCVIVNFPLMKCICIALTISNGPQDTTVCINQVANCTCGFTGADPNFVVPNWRIIKRRNGEVVSNGIITGRDIITNTNDGLEWISDPFNGNISVLRVGPVNRTDDQSSYQCSFALLNEIIESTIIGTVTVVGKLDSTTDQ